MKLFGKGKKKEENDVLQQNLSEEEENPGLVFMMRLLMKEHCKMPAQEKMVEVMQNHLGDVDCFSYDKNMAAFAINKYEVEFEEGKIPPQLFVMECTKSDGFVMDEITKSQMWDLENSNEILSECQYVVTASDMLAAGLDYKDRADMLMDYLEALVELYPTCEAVHFVTSGKMFSREQIINHNIPRKDRFIYFAVNVRFFNIQGTEDMMVDTIGMSTLFLPDLQYHFHGMNPDKVVNHAYNMLSYIYDNQCPIDSGDTIDGMTDADEGINPNIQWKCQYENSLIQPVRGVIDICMGEYASGKRG